MRTIKQILMDRDGNSEEEAEERIEIAKEELQQMLSEGDEFSAYDICEIHFGLEPDYLMELI